MTVYEFEEKVGWKIGDLLTDPQKLSEFNIEGLRNICEELCINWSSFLQLEQ
jgi:hypothetical protein